jgi:serine/threonine protein kinase/tetratricopeptide (TPR) repeat protein
MSSSLEDQGEPRGGRGPGFACEVQGDADPWLHFTFASEEGGNAPDSIVGDPATGPHSHRGCAGGSPSSPESLAVLWPSEPGADRSPDAASRLAADLFRRRRRGDTASFSADEAPCATADGSCEGPGSGRSPSPSGSFRAASLGGDRFFRLPEVGDSRFGFRLRYPLGRGAFARVFLAEQSDLAGRPVVLKVSAIEGSEPQTLAQLQHTNIVPIYSVHEDPRAGLRAVCMPYFGGASLSSVLQQLWSEDPPPTQGDRLLVALDAVASPPPGTFRNGVQVDLGAAVGLAVKCGPEPGPGDDREVDREAPLQRLRAWSYVQATAWIVAELAEGLHHAHRRGIFHRDIKPSNVLLSAEAQPLLLDFNLAQDQAIDPELATLGGTVAYMAPEHLRALAGRSATLIRQVDQRSDIYSLGMVLAEMLTGQSPFDQSASYSAVPLQIEAMAVERSKSWPSVRQRRPDLPWGLESIARMCLAPEPSRRYQQADHLAEDLRRFLDDRPLKYAPELSRAERVHKFARRHPRLTSSGSIAAAAVAAVLAVGSALAGVHDRLGAAQARDRFQAHERGTNQALCLVNTVLDLEDNLREGVRLCEKTLHLYEVRRGKSWQDHPDIARLTPDERRRLAEDRRELLMLLAAARVRLAPDDRAARRQAVALLDQAEASGGLPPSRALWLERAENLERLGDAARAADARRRAEQVPATTARDHYALATAYGRKGGAENYRRAIAELDLALRINPRHYWSSVQRGICHLELGEPLLAAADFGQCIGLWPEFAWSYFNRGCVLDRAGRKAEAIADYTAALGRDPNFVPALINRGLASLELKRDEPALADFDRALALGRDDATIDAGRGIALERLGRHAEADAAFAGAFRRMAPRPDPARARLCWSYGFAVARRLPQKARAAFDDVLLQEPHHPQALYGRAMLAAEEGKSDEAIAAFDGALKSNPGFNEARRFRAVLLARKRDWEHATQDINWCLEREPASGETLYAAACIAALAAGVSPRPQVVNQALDLLRRALDHEPLAARAAADADLAAIRPDPRFRMLLERSAQAGPGDRQEERMH